MSNDRVEEIAVLTGQISALNEEIKQLASKLEGILNVDCSLGACAFDPEVDDVHEKIEEVGKKRSLLERIRNNLDSSAAG